MRWRPVLATTTIAAALGGYILATREADDELTDLPAPAQPGYYLQQATIVETGADGNARMKLHARQISQNLNDDSISLQQVTVDYVSEDSTAWLLTADQGHLPTGAKVISFNGNVYIRPQHVQESLPEIRTEVLNIDPDQNLATAPGKVSFALDNQLLTAVGMKFDFKRQKLRLESQINGQFHGQ